MFIVEFWMGDARLYAFNIHADDVAKAVAIALPRALNAGWQQGVVGSKVVVLAGAP